MIKSEPIGSMGLFYFPETVNNVVVRFNGFFTFSIALLSVIFYENRTTPWVMLFLAIDFSSRLIYGSTVSPLGTGAMLLALPFKPIYACGPPKQFASFCGLFFSSTAAGLWLGITYSVRQFVLVINNFMHYFICRWLSYRRSGCVCNASWRRHAGVGFQLLFWMPDL